MRGKFIIAASILLGSASTSCAGDLPAKAANDTGDAPFFTVNDNRLTLGYIATGTDPGVPATTAKKVVAFTHFDVWEYGTNFFNFIYYKSDHHDPASPCPIGGATGCDGATEIFAQGRSTLGFNQIFHTNAFSWGPLRNVSIEVGADGETENVYKAPARTVGVAGLQFAFDLPYRGFFNVAPMYYKEVNHNALLFNSGLVGGHTDFDGTWTIETNYYMDLGFLPQWSPLSVSGRAAWIGKKGFGTNQVILNNFPTAMEFNSEPVRLTLDVSRMMWGDKRSHFLDVWVAYRYWQNKYGLDHERSLACLGANINSCTESSVFTGVSVKF
jgi:hypothetical protein